MLERLNERLWIVVESESNFQKQNYPIPQRTNCRCRHNNQRLEKRNGWLRESVDEWSIRPIYAMSPDQYEELHETVTNKKKYLRKKAEEGNWETNTQPPKTITLPQLPPPKTGLCVPQYSSFERNILHLPDIYRLPDSLFKYLKGDKHDGN
jgi:hypothetical protein